jgi:hypothetical protein
MVSSTPDNNVGYVKFLLIFVEFISKSSRNSSAATVIKIRFKKLKTSSLFMIVICVTFSKSSSEQI